MDIWYIIGPFQKWENDSEVPDQRVDTLLPILRTEQPNGAPFRPTDIHLVKSELCTTDGLFTGNTINNHQYQIKTVVYHIKKPYW